MTTRQTLVVVSVVLLATLAVVVPAVSAQAGPTDGTTSVAATDGALTTETAAITVATAQTNETTASTRNETGNDSQFGTQMAAFMQSNAAQTEDSVENGMWEAAFERANGSERARLATSRVEKLNGRIAALARQNETLHEQYQNGTLSHEEYVAATSELDGRMEALRDGANGTASAAERAGVDRSALEELRNNARNMTGPEVAGIARGLTTGDRGPPDGVPGQGPPGENRSDQPGERPPADVPERSDDVGDNETDGEESSPEPGAGSGNDNGGQGDGGQSNGGQANSGQDNGGQNTGGDDTNGQGNSADNPGRGPG